MEFTQPHVEKGVSFCIMRETAKKSLIFTETEAEEKTKYEEHVGIGRDK